MSQDDIIHTANDVDHFSDEEVKYFYGMMPPSMQTSPSESVAFKRLVLKNTIMKNPDVIQIASKMLDYDRAAHGPSIVQSGTIVNIENDKLKYVGSINNKQRPHGKGSVYYKKSGRHFRGNFIDGEKHGIGEIMNSDGSGLVTYHNRNKIHGYGYETLYGKKNSDIKFYTQQLLDENRIQIVEYVPSSGEYKSHMAEREFLKRNPNFDIGHDFVQLGGKYHKTRKNKKSKKSKKIKKSKKSRKSRK